MPTRPFALANYDACVFDLDGTVWLGTTPIPGAAAFLDDCRSAGITVAFATNAVLHTPAALLSDLVAVGLALPSERVITSGLVMTRTLALRGVREIAGVMATALVDQLAEVGIDRVSPDDVDLESFPIADHRCVVMSAHRGATIGEIERLGRLAVAGHPLLVTSREPGFPVVGGIEPGGGTMIAALSLMYPSVEATVVGKPSAFYADAVADVVAGVAGVDRERVLMVGDSQRADVGIAHQLGCDSLLLTGHSVAGYNDALARPTYVADSLASPPQPCRREGDHRD